MIGGYLRINDDIYDTLLSITLVFAAWKLYTTKSRDSEELFSNPPPIYVALIVGALIGLLSGLIGVGGGIFLSPIIILFGWSDPKTTAGIAAIFIWVNSAAGLIGSSISGQNVIEFDVLIPFAIAVLIGGYFGSKYLYSQLTSVWSVRFIGFGLSYLVFPLMTWYLLGESMFTVKTILCIILSVCIILIQVFM